MKLKNYKEQLKEWPENGHHIMAQYDDEKIIVYQSYRPAIGNFAVKHQYFGGAFSLTRMTWIKPNFLWMMYRNGWATKEGQEIVLAISLKREVFDSYLSKAVYSSYQSDIYESREQWQEEVKNSNIRLQWDPDHDPYGAKLERRAIQIGIRNEDQFVLSNQLDKLELPEEKPYEPISKEVSSRLKISQLLGK